MVQLKIHQRYSKRERARKYLYYLENRIHRMVHGKDRVDYFRWRFIRQEDDYEEDNLPDFDEEILTEARNEIQDAANNNI